MSISKTPNYNLKAVLRETGLKPDVLRAWERRYGIPTPERTQGGHRLYSDYDMFLLKWLIARQHEGLSISRAVEMWREQLSQGNDSLADLLSKSVAPQPVSYSLPESNLDSLRSNWLSACLGFNEIAADQALNQAFALYPVEQVCTEVLQRGMFEIGSLWYENRASVQQEHFASALAMRRLDALLAASPAPTRNQTILLGCPAEEEHTFPLLMLALFLRRRGLNIIYLGANVPANRFEETIHAVHADMVILASQQLSTTAALQQTAALISASGAQIAFGGRIFNLLPEIVQSIPAHFLGNSLEAALGQIEALLASPQTTPAAREVPPNYTQTLRAFMLERPAIEATLNRGMGVRDEIPAYLATANQFMGNNIVAALQLGSVHYADAEIDWLAGMLKGHQLDLNRIFAYLRMYASAAEKQLGETARPVAEWLVEQSHN